jgi:hypothetical protein
MPDPEEKVLGIMWSTNTDTLGFKVVYRPPYDFTRVELISQVASVFDPLGTASPLIEKAKIRLCAERARQLLYHFLLVSSVYLMGKPVIFDNLL